jgi:hypothetical protein
MRSDGDTWEYGEEGDAGKENTSRNILKNIPETVPGLTQPVYGQGQDNAARLGSLQGSDRSESKDGKAKYISTLQPQQKFNHTSRY